MPDEHALGGAGGAGGVDQVRAGTGGHGRVERGAGVQALPNLGRIDVQESHIRVDREPGVAQHRGGGGVVEQGAQPRRRVGDVQRQVHGAGAGDGEDRHHQVERAGQRDGDDVLDAEPALGEHFGERPGAGVQLGVGQGVGAVGERDRVGAAACLLGNQRGQRGRVGGRPGRGRVVVGAEQVDAADGDGRVGGDHVEDAQQERRPRGDGVVVEQAAVVGEHPVEPGGGADGGTVLADGDLEIESGRAGGHLADPGHAGHVEAVQREALVGEHHLEDRVVPRRGGAEGVDDPVERHVGVRERVEVDAAGVGEQFRERRAGRHGQPQRDGADEHAGHVVEHRVDPPGDGGADGDVLGGGQGREQHGERGVHDHERRRVVGAGQLVDGGVQFGGHREAHAPGGAVAVAAGTVGGQGQQRRGAGEGAGPVRELAGGEAVGVGRVAEQGVLPAGVVAVGDGQRRPRRGAPVAPGGVGEREVAAERQQRQPVDGEVVQHHREGVAGAGAVEAGAQRRVDGEIETGAGEFGEGVVEVGGCRVWREVEGDAGQHPLRRPVRAVGVDGAQHGVPGDHVRGGDREGVEVGAGGEVDGERDVVAGGGVGDVEPVGEPHPLLRRRERHRTGVVGRQQRKAFAGNRIGHGDGEAGDGGVFEDLPHADAVAGDRAEARGELGGEQRVAAEREEIVVGGDGGHVEQGGDDTGDEFLGGAAISGARAVRVRGGFGQRGAVDLAGARERQRVEDGDRGGHHVPRQPRGDELPQLGRVEAGGVGTVYVRDKRLAPHDGDGGGDRGMPGEGGVDLAEFDAEPAELDLMVDPPDELEGGSAAGVSFGLLRPPKGHTAPAHQVARAVHATAAERGRDEAARGQARHSEVAAGQARPGEVQLADHADGHGPQPRAEHERGDAVEAGADGQPLPRHERRAGGGEHGGLGGPVHVEHGPAGRPPGRGLGRPRLAADGEHAQRVQARGVQLRRHGRGGEPVRDALGAQQFQQVLAAVHVRRRDDEGAAGRGGQEVLEHRRVERGRREVQHPRLRVEVHPTAQRRDERREPPVGDDDPLRHAGRAGGVDEVRGVVGPQRTHPVGVGDRRRPRGSGGRVDECDAVGQRRAGPGDDVPHPGVGEDLGDPHRRLRRVDGHKRRPGQRDGGHRAHRVHRPGQQDRHPILRAETALDQVPRQRCCGGDQLDRRAARSAHPQRVRGEQLRQRRDRPGVCQDDLGGAELEIADGCLRRGDGRVEHRVQAGHRGGDRRALEQGTVVDHPSAQRAVGQLAHRDLHVEPGAAGRDLLGAHGQAGQREVGHGDVVVGEHHLERGEPECIDDAVERHRRVRVGVEVRATGGGEQLGERRGRVHVEPQRDGADEHANETLEVGVLAAGRAGADGDVAPPGPRRQPHGDGGVHRHERGGVVRGGQAAQRLEPRGGDGEFERLGRSGAAGAGTVGGQRRRLAQPGERGGPVREFAGGEAVRVVRVAEQGAVPAGVVGVPQRQRLPPRAVPGGAGGVGGGEVEGQRHERRAVHGDVVGDDGEHVPVRAHAQQPHPQRDAGGEVERCGGPLGDQGVHVGRVDGFDVEGGQHLGHGPDPLPRAGFGVDRAQDLVPVEDVAERGAQRGRVEGAVEVQRERQVVGGGVTVGEQPQPSLRGGERRGRVVVRAGGRGHRGDGSGVDGRGELGDGGMVEHVAQVHVAAERGPEPRRELCRAERMPAEGEEVRVRPHPVDADDLAHQLRDERLGRAGRRPRAGGRVHRGGGQGATVDLAARGERQRVEDGDRRGPQVGGQALGEADVHVVGLDVADDVGRERVAADDDGRARDVAETRERRLDLAGFDAVAADLHLPVGAPDELQDVPAARARFW